MATISAALAIALEHHRAGRLEVAEEIYRRVLAVEPNQPDALHLLGALAHQSGRHEAAIETIEAAIQLRQDDAGFHHNLGEAYRALRRIPEAIRCYRRAIELDPHSADPYNGLGNALNDQGEPAEAVACFERAIQLRPDFTEAYNNQGVLLRDRGQVTAAIPWYQKALELKPDYAPAHNNLGDALKDQGRTEEAIACYRQALRLRPDSAVMHSNLLLTTQYRSGVGLRELAEAHAEYDLRHAAPLRNTWPAHENTRDPERPLRLGFLSPDFGQHPVGFFLIPVLENLDPRQCETVCYHDQMGGDDRTARFQAAATAWQDVSYLGDQRLAEQIRADRIDILFDLAGHTAEGRLLLFARKPAPIQITWLGYEGTTGLSAMDYLIADRHMTPQGSEPYYREQILRMPDAYLCYAPPAEAPPVGPLPAASSGHVTFGSFNNPAKIGPQVVEIWAEILRRVPRSRLVMKYLGLGDESVRRRYLDQFAAAGVEPERLLLLPPTSYAEYLAGYHPIDISLDPFPFSGSATTCESLWMGVPVITCPGETFAGRHGLTHLENVGLADEFVARDLSHYVELAVRWANDLDRLAEVRASLRQRMAASPLCDGKRFAVNLMALLRDVWGKWVSGV